MATTDLANVIGLKPLQDLENMRGGMPANHLRWEARVAQPALERRGYRVDRWITTERDSFGPLGRAAVCEKDGRIPSTTAKLR